jgi:LPXTG-motif cell wall-anchored protein
MRLAATFISVLLILMGGLWALQGVGLVGGSFMTGDSNWLYIGIATAIAGVAGLVFFRRRRTVR